MIGGQAGLGKTSLEVGVVVPGIVWFVHDLDETDAGFDKAACHQALGAVFGGGRILQAVELLGCGGFGRKIQVLLGGKLHPRGQLVVADASFQVGGLGEAVGIFLVQATDQSQVIPVGAGGKFSGGSQIEHR